MGIQTHIIGTLTKELDFLGFDESERAKSNRYRGSRGAPIYLDLGQNAL